METLTNFKLFFCITKKYSSVITQKPPMPEPHEEFVGDLKKFIGEKDSGKKPEFKPPSDIPVYDDEGFFEEIYDEDYEDEDYDMAYSDEAIFEELDPGAEDPGWTPIGFEDGRDEMEVIEKEIPREHSADKRGPSEGDNKDPQGSGRKPGGADQDTRFRNKESTKRSDMGVSNRKAEEGGGERSEGEEGEKRGKGEPPKRDPELHHPDHEGL